MCTFNSFTCNPVYELLVIRNMGRSNARIIMWIPVLKIPNILSCTLGIKLTSFALVVKWNAEHDLVGSNNSSSILCHRKYNFSLVIVVQGSPYSTGLSGWYGGSEAWLSCRTHAVIHHIIRTSYNFQNKFDNFSDISIFYVNILKAVPVYFYLLMLMDSYHYLLCWS